MGGYAEVIYETGSHSGIQYDDIEEVKGALAEQQRRAVAGEEGGPTGHPAERVARVLLYPENPADMYDDENVDATAMKSLIDGMAKDGKVNAAQLVAAVRDEVSAVYPLDQGRHASMWKAQETEELDLSFLNGESGEAA